MYFFLTVRLCRGIPTGKSSSSSSQSVPTGCWCCGPAPCPPLFPAVKKTGNRTTTYDNSVCVFKKRGRIDRYIYIYIKGKLCYACKTFYTLLGLFLLSGSLGIYSREPKTFQRQGIFSNCTSCLLS